MAATTQYCDANSPRSLIFQYKSTHDWVFLSSSVLSVLGCLFIIVTFLTWRAIRTPSRSILVFISISDLLVVSPDISGVFSSYTNRTDPSHIQAQTDCDAAAAVNTFGNISSILWTVALALYLHSAIVKDDILRGNWLISRVFTPLCWGIPAVVTVTAHMREALGYDQDFLTSGWCWVRVHDASNMTRAEIEWVFVAGKGWEIAAYIIITALYVSIICSINRKVSRHSLHSLPSEVEALRKARMKMMMIPAVFILLRFWGTLRVFWLLISPKTVCKYKDTLVALLFLQAVGDTGQGWANCLLYGCFTVKIRSILKSRMPLSCVSKNDDDLEQLRGEYTTASHHTTESGPTVSSLSSQWLSRSQVSPKPETNCN